MLTRALLRWRARGGRAVPQFVDPDDAAAQEAAASLLACVAAHRGRSRGSLEEALAGLTGSCVLQRGLAKLALDRCEFAAADAGATARRLALLQAATATWRAAARSPQLPAQLAAMRPDDLYDDLPARRPLLAAELWPPPALLRRYNTALVQGLVMAAEQLTVEVIDDDVARLRRLLRWLKFCRLLAEVHRPAAPGAPLRLSLSGPAAGMAHGRAYGLALAQFVLEVPLLRRFRLSAALTLRPGQNLRLELDEAAPLARGSRQAPGCVPPEIQQLAAAAAGAGWQLAAAPPPRPIGVADMVVPDLRATADDGFCADVELFHRWHAGPLARRLAQLAQRPSTTLVVGIDRRLKVAVPAGVAGFLFSDVPTPRGLLGALAAARTAPPAMSRASAV